MPHRVNEVLCDLFYCPAGLLWVSSLSPHLLPPSLVPIAASLVSFRFCFAVSRRGQLPTGSITFIYSINTILYMYVYVACTLCYLLCRQDVVDEGKRVTYFAKLPIVGFIFGNVLETDSSPCLPKSPI